jgi:hypothetical protein
MINDAYLQNTKGHDWFIDTSINDALNFICYVSSLGNVIEDDE